MDIRASDWTGNFKINATKNDAEQGRVLGIETK
jgi:hypothetical protein